MADEDLLGMHLDCHQYQLDAHDHGIDTDAQSCMLPFILTARCLATIQSNPDHIKVCKVIWRPCRVMEGMIPAQEDCLPEWQEDFT